MKKAIDGSNVGVGCGGSGEGSIADGGGSSVLRAESFGGV